MVNPSDLIITDSCSSRHNIRRRRWGGRFRTQACHVRSKSASLPFLGVEAFAGGSKVIIGTYIGLYQFGMVKTVEVGYE